MKIAFILPGIPGTATGGSKVIFEYANQFANDGFNVYIYYLHCKKPTPIINAIYSISLNYKARFAEPKWFSLNKEIKKKVIFSLHDLIKENESFDVVIATSIETTELVYNLPKKYGKKLYFIQGFENWTVSDETVFYSYALGMKNVVVSKWLQSIVDKYSKEPSILISNGINTSIFKSDNKQRTDHSIVFQYRISKQKGCEYALETIRILKQKYPDLSVNIISIEKNKPDIPSYCHYHFGLTPEQVAEVNNQSEVFICSTIDEGFGLPGLEAMACGCAVCSTDYTGVHEYAVDGYNALLSPVRDPQAMADNVSRLFDDEELRKKIVANGIKTGKEKSVDNSYKKFKSVLEETIKE